MRTSLDRDVDLVSLGEELGDALGRPVSLAAQLPGQLDEAGKPMPGVLVLLDDTTGEPLPDTAVDIKVVRRVITAHVYVDPDEQPSPEESLVEALAAASTVAGLRDALVTHYTPAAEKAGAVRARRAAEKATRRGSGRA